MARVGFVLLVVIGVLCGMTVAQFKQPQPLCKRPNQEFTICGSACPASCTSPPDQICTMQCMVGWQCKKGYLLNSAGQCVSLLDCGNEQHVITKEPRNFVERQIFTKTLTKNNHAGDNLSVI